MKKGLLLSIVASTVLFAGGDIAPVQPVAEAPAAACNDFYGQVGAAVVYGTTTKAGKDDMVKYGVAAVLGVNKEIFSGLTVSAELQGSIFKGYDITTSTSTATVNRANLTQLNLGYSFCNTAIKVGRFSVAMGLSPLVFTDTFYDGLKNVTFDGVMVANTDIPDTVVYGAYIYRAAAHGASTTLVNPMGSVDGAAVVGFQNKSFADTTITGVGYYAVTSGDYAVAGTIDKKWCDTDISIGGAYEKAGVPTAYLVGGYITQHFSAFDLTVAGTYQSAASTYINDGEAMGKYTWKTWQANTASWAAGAAISTDWCGYKLGAGAKYREDESYEIDASIGKTFSGIAFATDVRYRYNGVTTKTATRVRARAVYKF